MPLIELQLLLPARDVDAWSDALLEAGALSVSIEDEDCGTAREVAAYGEPGAEPQHAAWTNNRVSVLLDAGTDAAMLLASIAGARAWSTPRVAQRRVLEDCDWVRQSQAQFEPLRIGRVWIVPSWHTPPDPAAVNLRIDPGAAFGTGTHATTRLCLAWIEAHMAAGSRVLDYGCGSGILSIGAGLLGATEVTGVDIDGQALAVARSNAERNGVTARYTTPEQLASERARRFDVVIANILASPLMLLAPALSARVGRGGALLLSGILERQAAEVIDVYRRADAAMPLQVHAAEDGWVLLAGRRAD